MKVYKNYRTPSEAPIGAIHKTNNTTHVLLDEIVFLGDDNARGSLVETAKTVDDSFIESIQTFGIKRAIPVLLLDAWDHLGRQLVLAVDAQRRGIALHHLRKTEQQVAGKPVNEYEIKVEVLIGVNPYDEILIDKLQLIYNDHTSYQDQSFKRMIAKWVGRGMTVEQIQKDLGMSRQRIWYYMPMQTNEAVKLLVDQDKLSVNAANHLVKGVKATGMDAKTLYQTAERIAEQKGKSKVSGTHIQEVIRITQRPKPSTNPPTTKQMPTAPSTRPQPLNQNTPVPTPPSDFQRYALVEELIVYINMHVEMPKTKEALADLLRTCMSMIINGASVEYIKEALQK